jgi:beta-phosphoglucomutase
LASAPEALIFDFDGVIADTEPYHWQSWVDILAPRGFDLNWQDYCRVCRGVAEKNMLEALEKLTPAARAWTDLPQHFPERKRRVLARVWAEPPIAPETIALLQSLAGRRVGLVTSALEQHVAPVLRATGIYACFDALVYGDETLHHKPAPDPYLLAMKKLGVSGGMAFEDSPSGIDSARAAGLEVIEVEDPARLPELVRMKLR